MKSIMLVLTLALVACESAPDLEEAEQAASTILAKNVSYVANTGLVGANAQKALDNVGSRIATLEANAPVPGPQGPQGPEGPEGPQGPQGPAGTQHLNWAQKSWNQTHVAGWNVTGSIPCCGWQTIQESELQMTTSGGALMIAVAIELAGAQTATCQTIVDGVWAGAYSNGAVVGAESPISDTLWKEGKLTFNQGWHAWRVTRIYPGIPAGLHTIAVQCASDNGALSSCAGKVGGCSLSVVEL